MGSSVELLQFEMSVFSDVAQLELAKEKLSEEVANIRKDKVMSKAVALVLCTQLCITHLPLQAGSRYVIFAVSLTWNKAFTLLCLYHVLIITVHLSIYCLKRRYTPNFCTVL